MPVVEFHARLGNTAFYFAALMGLWGLFRFFRQQPVNSSYWGALVIAEILFIAQSGLGAFLWLSGIGNLAGQWMHILYGVVSILVIPGVFAFTKGDEKRRAMLVYGVAFLFLVGVILRAIAVAPQ
jgi:hypothetical protein